MGVQAPSQIILQVVIYTLIRQGTQPVVTLPTNPIGYNIQSLVIIGHVFVQAG
jgi:non-ribosomal peptide synthetase component E (peptide arylation enzyme)